MPLPLKKNLKRFATVRGAHEEQLLGAADLWMIEEKFKPHSVQVWQTPAGRRTKLIFGLTASQVQELRSTEAGLSKELLAENKRLRAQLQRESQKHARQLERAGAKNVELLQKLDAAADKINAARESERVAREEAGFAQKELGEAKDSIARLHAPKNGTEPPDDVIPVAERSLIPSPAALVFEAGNRLRRVHTLSVPMGGKSR